MAHKYDFHFQGVAPADLTGFKFFTRGFSRTVAVRGINKLINVWTKLFLTSKGSDPTDIDRGTTFPALIGSNITDAQGLRDVVLLAIADCNAQLQVLQRQSIPDLDETLRSATLTQFGQLTPDGIQVYIGITNMKDEQASILLPLLIEA
ncbi:hypothetical protein KJ782_07170 [Patescibacteria group bacterium]|nr:hypothetical protein [Patescibacteria group bacterium]